MSHRIQQIVKSVYENINSTIVFNRKAGRSKECSATPISHILSCLSSFFYGYNKKPHICLSKLNIPMKYRKGVTAYRVMLLTEDQYTKLLKDGIVPNTYSSWAKSSNGLEGYLGFVGRSKDWTAVLFQSKLTSKDVVLNLTDFGNDIKVHKEYVDKFGDNEGLYTLFHEGDAGGVMDEILSTKKLTANMIVGIKSYKTHKSPLGGRWLKPGLNN